MTATAGRRSRSKALPWLAGAAALVVVALVAGGPRSKGEGSTAFDPESTAPSGARALVLLLESFDAEVDITSDLPTADTDVAFMFSDVIPEDRHDQMESWIREGGTLVVADSRSEWTPEVVDGEGGFGMGGLSVGRGRCTMRELTDLTELETSGAATGFDPPPGSLECFTDFDPSGDTGALVVATPLGSGRIVSVGDRLLLTNELLDQADNAALATALLLPDDASSGTPTVALLQMTDEAVAEGDRSLSDAISPGARLALVQLLAAFLVYAWYRSRRVGAPIVEPQPVAIAGSELVSAVGQLMQQSRDPDRAARALRADLRRRLGERFGLGSNAPPDALVGVVAERTGIDPDRLYALVSDQPVTTDRELVELAANIDDVRKEILHGP